MAINLLAIGTGKGLFLARSEDDRRTWEVSGPHFPMTGVVRGRHRRPSQPGAPAGRRGQLALWPDRGDQRRPGRDLGRARRAADRFS
jgi:hypothetical protein